VVTPEKTRTGSEGNTCGTFGYMNLSYAFRNRGKFTNHLICVGKVKVVPVL
jgi:hypothetical protein